MYQNMMYAFLTFFNCPMQFGHSQGVFAKWTTSTWYGKEKGGGGETNPIPQVKY